MKVIKLKTKLVEDIRQSTEVKVAVALMSGTGLDVLIENLPADAKLQLLIGIDLPTSPDVFRSLLGADKVETRVYLKGNFFHPKLYVVKGRSNSAYVGSGNCTSGGMENNIELFAGISVSSEVSEYELWFDTYFRLGTTITEEWIEQYEEVFDIVASYGEKVKRQMGRFKGRFGVANPQQLAHIDFTHQFFKYAHHNAFTGNKPYSDDVAVVNERFEVGEKLRELHDLVMPLITSKRWDIHPHEWNEYVTSSFKHGEYTSDALDGMWLHYGRSGPQLDKFKEAYGDKQSSLYHMRLEVLIRAYDVGLWLRVGKNNGSIVDRENFKRRMDESQSYRDTFYRLVVTLPADHYVYINGAERKVNTFSSSEELHEFVRKDNTRTSYFIIGEDLLPGDVRLSESNIANTVVTSFEKLYPIYQHIKTIL